MIDMTLPTIAAWSSYLAIAAIVSTALGLLARGLNYWLMTVFLRSQTEKQRMRSSDIIGLQVGGLLFAGFILAVL